MTRQRQRRSASFCEFSQRPQPKDAIRRPAQVHAHSRVPGTPGTYMFSLKRWTEFFAHAAAGLLGSVEKPAALTCRTNLPTCL